jgi:hypothetical protein
MEPRIRHDVLGEFAYDEGLAWYEGSVNWAGEKASLSLSAESPAELPASIDTICRLLDQAATLHSKLIVSLTDELLPLKNGEWFNPERDAQPYTPETFAAALRIERITAFPDGSAEFYFEDGGLFFGHTLIASIDGLSGEIEATLAG